MRLNKFLYASIFIAAFTISCDKDDDPDPEVEPERDRAEQALEDQDALEEYLQSHFYNYEDFENPSEGFDYIVRFDTIAGENEDKMPLIDSDLLEAKTVTRNDIDYTVYVLKVREGVEDQPKFTDSTLVSYRGELLNRNTFDRAETPVWFDLVRYIPGFVQGVVEFKGASGYDLNPDNTITWENDYGIGAVFMPSGLGYFSSVRTGIPSYSPLIFSFHLYGVNEADHDNDGIPSYMEDLDNNGIVQNDDTDGDNFPNYNDSDDDGDFIPTRDEIEIDEETGEITFTDTNGDGTPDYLDPNI